MEFFIMDEIITLICPVNAASGRGDELKTALTALAKASTSEAGNICYRLHSTDDPDEFVIYEQWRNSEALDIHMQTPHLLEFLADKNNLLAGQPAGKFVKEIKF